MRNRDKAVESSARPLLPDAGDPPCRKHPSSSSVGICADCLKDRLLKLVCSDCGEQRLSSCSCSDISSNRNSCSVEIGSVGRISFLVENDGSGAAADPLYQSKLPPKSKKLAEKVDAPAPSKRNGSLWRMGWIFRKKKGAQRGKCSATDGKSESFSSSDRLAISGPIPEVASIGKSHDFNIDMIAGLSSEPRKDLPHFKTLPRTDLIDLDADHSPPRRGALSGLKSSSFAASEDDSDLGSEQRRGRSSSFLRRFGSLRCGRLEHEESSPAFVGLRSCSLDHEPGSLSHFRRSGSIGSRSSCRITVNDCDTGEGKKSGKVWKWIFKNSRGRSVRT